jgi:hypothetical protein
MIQDGGSPERRTGAGSEMPTHQPDLARDDDSESDPGTHQTALELLLCPLGLLFLAQWRTCAINGLELSGCATL